VVIVVQIVAGNPQRHAVGLPMTSSCSLMSIVATSKSLIFCVGDRQEPRCVCHVGSPNGGRFFEETANLGSLIRQC